MTDDRPNIVLVLTDDHAAHAISCYGSALNVTPQIDAIAAGGVRLDRMLCTNALCAPSRASILTGTYSHVNGVTTLSTSFDATQATFVSELRTAGYRTALVGKWHLGVGEAHDPQGFDYWDVLIGQGEYIDPRFRSTDGVRVEPGYCTEIVTDLALHWLDELPGDEPWCLLIHHKAPHRPWVPDAAHAGMYTDVEIPRPATFGDSYSTRSAAVRHTAMRVADDLSREDLKVDPPDGLGYDELAAWKYQRYLEDYLAVVASVDDNVGRVVDRLRDRGELDNTLLIYTSDQGFFVGDHGWYDKRFMYEESLRMPFVMSCPDRIPSGTVHHGLTTNVDLAQTLLDAAGVAAPDRMQGRSFWPDVTIGPVELPAAGVYYRYWENDSLPHHVLAHYGYRDHRYKIIYYYGDGLGLPGTSDWTFPPEWELYDLEQDPAELTNVYHDPAYARVRDDLTATLWRAQAAVGDRPHPGQPRPAGV